MNKLINFTFSLFLLIILIFLLLNPSLVINSVLESSTMFFKTIFSTMFPFLLISYFLINYNVIYNIAYLINKIFRINPNLLIIVFLSLISGFPSSAVYINNLYKEGFISSEDAINLIYRVFFPSPMYVIGTIGSIYLNNIKYSIFILLSIYITNIILIISYKMNNTSFKKITKKNNIGFHIKNSIITSINTLLVIMGSIIMFNIIINIINSYIILPNFLKVITCSILEMSNGIYFINSLFINIKLKAILFSLTLTFSGLCIHSQILSIIEFKIKYSTLLKYRVFACLINFIIITLLTCA